MKSFGELEADFQTEAVWLPEQPMITGILQLGRKETTLNLTSKRFFHFETDDNGWFDLRLSGSRGVDMLAHNLVFHGTGQSYGSDRETVHFAKTFPNVLVTDIRSLNDDLTVNQISFELRGWNYFFYYRYTESLQAFDLPVEDKKRLRELRYMVNEGGDDIFNPSHIYVCSWPDRLIDFVANGDSYSVRVVGKGRMGSFHGISLELGHVATIKFALPTTIDQAIEKIYEWRRFFVQVAMVPLAFESVAFSRDDEPNSPVGYVYLPYAVNDDDPKQGYYGLHPAYIPYNSWADRSLLADTMKNWLEKSSYLLAFRSRLDRVIRSINEEVDQSDLNDLCSAIDGHPELAGKEKISKEQLEIMAGAAHGAVQGLPSDVTPTRIKGLLGQLQRWSLRRKLDEAASRSLGSVFPDAVPEVLSLAVRMRQGASHRGIVEEPVHPLVQPVVQALASICVALDLGRAGMPILGKAEAPSGRWINRFSDSAQEIRRCGSAESS